MAENNSSDTDASLESEQTGEVKNRPQPVKTEEVSSSEWRRSHRVRAWGVHLFTGGGVICACFATLSLAEDKILVMWGWLALSLVIDGVDGTLARKNRVSDVVPWFDGVALDLIIDFLTWTFIPALFMYRHLEFGPAGLPDKIISVFVMLAITISSMFCYCNKNMKSHDNYFVGFPAAWNIVALYFWLLPMPWYLNLSISLLLVVLTVLPIAFCHPFRVKRFMVVNLLATVVWFIDIIWLTVSFPARNPFVWWSWWISGIWIIGIGVVRTIQGRDTAQQKTV